MKKIVFIVICLMTGGYSLQAVESEKGNIQVKGRIQVDGTNEDIPYVTITVQNDSARVITRQASDDAGRFTLQLKAGSYKLILSAVGYTTTEKEVTLAEGEAAKDLGNIT
ncbi:MAG: carboxypeptidase-like regulatory domain-containing protein, partial [Tannerella sp.]|nr:carboxypeptidase-like regulatory domain-containing protein [Tannerella sp.]